MRAGVLWVRKGWRNLQIDDLALFVLHFEDEGMVFLGLARRKSISNWQRARWRGVLSMLLDTDLLGGSSRCSLVLDAGFVGQVTLGLGLALLINHQDSTGSSMSKSNTS